MRLINTTTLELHDFFESEIPEYAILSHTWGDGEISYQQYQEQNCSGLAGYIKIRRFCQIALEAGWNYAWIDTCCIDKKGSAELSEAINFMFKWYEGAGICFTYLVDVTESPKPDEGLESQFCKAKWFTRGWCLQELLAPSNITFMDVNWNVIGDDYTLRRELSLRTGIQDLHDWRTSCIAVKFSWAAGRQTTRSEDQAYCLLGIFDINMPPLYGEGDKAFQRLQLEILRQSDDESIFAWRDPSDRGSGVGLLAKSPAYFAASRTFRRMRSFLPDDQAQPAFQLAKELKIRPWIDQLQVPTEQAGQQLQYRAPYSMTNKGLQLNFPVLPSRDATTCSTATQTQDTLLLPILCKINKDSSVWVAINLRRVRDQVYARINANSLFWVEDAKLKQAASRILFVRQIVSHDSRPFRGPYVFHFRPRPSSQHIIEFLDLFTYDSDRCRTSHTEKAASITGEDTSPASDSIEWDSIEAGGLNVHLDKFAFSGTAVAALFKMNRRKEEKAEAGDKDGSDAALNFVVILQIKDHKPRVRIMKTPQEKPSGNLLQYCIAQHYTEPKLERSHGDDACQIGPKHNASAFLAESLNESGHPSGSWVLRIDIRQRTAEVDRKVWI